MKCYDTSYHLNKSDLKVHYLSSHLSSIEYKHFWPGIVSPTTTVVCHPVKSDFSYFGLQTPQKPVCGPVGLDGYINIVSHGNSGTRPARRILRARCNVTWYRSHSGGPHTQLSSVQKIRLYWPYAKQAFAKTLEDTKDCS